LTERDIARLGGVGILTPEDIEDFSRAERRRWGDLPEGNTG
tara:strand:- start:1 stop:123 length:123 start_codon:yes stop_codon:yes gene_type:complete